MNKEVTLRTDKIPVELAYTFTCLDHYFHVRKHGSGQADFVLEECRVLDFDTYSAEGTVYLNDQTLIMYNLKA